MSNNLFRMARGRVAIDSQMPFENIRQSRPSKTIMNEAHPMLSPTGQVVREKRNIFAVVRKM